MPVKRSTKLAIAQRRQQVADLYLQGCTQLDISQRVGVVQSVVSNDLDTVRREWRESSVRDFDLAREIELKKIDRIEREASAAWERSQKPAQSADLKGDDNARPTRKRIKNQYGDPRFLEVILKCVALRRTLLCLDEPPQTENTQCVGIHVIERIVECRERSALTGYHRPDSVLSVTSGNPG